jgi:predicted phage terminase large subunit-like protein
VEAAIHQTAERDGAAVIIALPQDPGQAGQAQAAYLTRKLAGFVVRSSPETGAKLTRAGPVAAQIEASNLSLVRAPWNRAFLEELRDFPHGGKDDQVDALSRAFMTLVASASPARRLHVPLLSR